MADMKRLGFTTIEFGNEKPKKKDDKKIAPSIRFDLKLFDTTEQKYPHFNYTTLLKNEEKKRKKKEKKKDDNGIANGDPFNDDEDDKVLDIARYFEEKYGNRKKNDYADLGAGYDESDSFIDNTDAYDEIVPEEMTTVHGGFYVNSGPLEFKNTDNLSLLHRKDASEEDDDDEEDEDESSESSDDDSEDEKDLENDKKKKESKENTSSKKVDVNKKTTPKVTGLKRVNKRILSSPENDESSPLPPKSKSRLEEPAKPTKSQMDQVSKPYKSQTEQIMKPQKSQVDQVSKPSKSHIEQIAKPKSQTEPVLKPSKPGTEQVSKPSKPGTEQISKPSKSGTELLLKSSKLQVEQSQKSSKPQLEQTQKPSKPQVETPQKSKSQEQHSKSKSQTEQIVKSSKSQMQQFPKPKSQVAGPSKIKSQIQRHSMPPKSQYPMSQIEQFQMLQKSQMDQLSMYKAHIQRLSMPPKPPISPMGQYAIPPTSQMEHLMSQLSAPMPSKSQMELLMASRNPMNFSMPSGPQMATIRPVHPPGPTSTITKAQMEKLQRPSTSTTETITLN